MIVNMEVFYVALGMLSIGIVCCFFRIVLGPTLSDRVVALDLMTHLVISIIAIYSVGYQESVYMDVVIALALIIFLGTVAFAQYIEWQVHRKTGEKRK
ncbi:MAG: cation:proton antiporter [Gammaproteobacteria bacterium RIFCSPHIGHO2_12_FULL_41_15]|nr:MAG: cation:proton antiporter [Gammaproteobacteria bacterium RIFCSPHIGHO2_12_FULL_41_15]